jgi:hypothetical protein
MGKLPYVDLLWMINRKSYSRINTPSLIANETKGKKSIHKII